MTNSVLDRIIKENFKDLAGTKLYFKVPLTRALVNWYIKPILPDQIKSAKIQSIEGRIIALHIETNIPLVPDFNITLELYEILALPRLELKMRILDGLGWLARGVVDKILPDGMDLEGKVLTVDLYQLLLENTSYRAIVDKIAFAQWGEEDDKLVLELELRF